MGQPAPKQASQRGCGRGLDLGRHRQGSAWQQLISPAQHMAVEGEGTRAGRAPACAACTACHSAARRAQRTFCASASRMVSSLSRSMYSLAWGSSDCAHAAARRGTKYQISEPAQEEISAAWGPVPVHTQRRERGRETEEGEYGLVFRATCQQRPGRGQSARAGGLGGGALEARRCAACFLKGRVAGRRDLELLFAAAAGSPPP